MTRGFIVVSVMWLLVISGCGEVAVETPAVIVTKPVAPARADVHRGVSWVAGHEIEDMSFDPLIAAGVEWIVQTPFGWQRSLDDPEVRLSSGRGFWGERDEGLIRTTRLASARGIHTMFKPHIWVSHGEFPGDIRMRNDADWNTWFESYERFMLHYAELASSLGVDALCIGTELRYSVVEHPERWRRLIRDIRSIYGGELTYAANWYEEYELVEFWDDLDLIGIQAYFPVATSDRPDIGELVAGWERHVPSIEAVQKKFGKPVIFTEIGYRSEPDAAIEPWRWPDRFALTDEIDYQTQAQCYEAFFRVFWHRPWFAGAYFWKWYPDHERSRVRLGIDFTPQNKPALEVLARWYSARSRETSP